jgi:hypothetical protein
MGGDRATPKKTETGSNEPVSIFIEAIWLSARWLGILLRPATHRPAVAAKVRPTASVVADPIAVLVNETGAPACASVVTDAVAILVNKIVADPIAVLVNEATTSSWPSTGVVANAVAILVNEVVTDAVAILVNKMGPEAAVKHGPLAVTRPVAIRWSLGKNCRGQGDNRHQNDCHCQ